ncbi:hypothetical protein CSC18_2098 [Klebsiella aerogenes]|nr:hypothetical protein CSC18_2098 [Klebsiella aerogenes]
MINETKTTILFLTILLRIQKIKRKKIKTEKKVVKNMFVGSNQHKTRDRKNSVKYRNLLVFKYCKHLQKMLMQTPK